MTSETDPKEVCRRVREAAAATGLSQSELAEKADVSGKMVYHVYNGTANLRPKSIGKLASALGVSVKWLMEGGRYPEIFTNVPEYPESSEGLYIPGKLSVSEMINLVAEQLGVDRAIVKKKILEIMESSI